VGATTAASAHETFLALAIFEALPSFSMSSASPAPATPTGILRLVIVLTTISAAVMELLDVTIVNVALTQVAGALGATIEDVA
jgi:hypothetical protein